MPVISFLIDPVESQVFRKPGEFNPDARFLFGVSTSYPLPLPTTVIGLLGWVVGDKPSSTGWVEEFRDVFSAFKNFTFRGSYLLCRYGNKYVPYVWYSDHEYYEGFAPLIRRDRDDVTLLMKLSGLCKEEALSVVDVRSIKSVGVHLERGYTGMDKVGIEGYLYFQEYIDYRSLFGEMGADAGYIAMDMKFEDGDVKRIEEGFGDGIVRYMGGETRSVVVKYGDKTLDQILAGSEEFEGEFSKGNDVILYLASPAIIRPSDDIIKSLDDAMKVVSDMFKDLDYVDSVDIKSSHTNVYIDIMGVGYHKYRGRKPVYRVIGPGSKVHVKLARDVGLEEIYWKGVGYASELGFGTLIPIKIRENE